MIKIHNCIQNKYLASYVGMCGSATQHVLLIVAKYVIHIAVQYVLPLFLHVVLGDSDILGYCHGISPYRRPARLLVVCNLCRCLGCGRIVGAGVLNLCFRCAFCIFDFRASSFSRDGKYCHARSTVHRRSLVE